MTVTPAYVSSADSHEDTAGLLSFPAVKACGPGILPPLSTTLRSSRHTPAVAMENALDVSTSTQHLVSCQATI